MSGIAKRISTSRLFQIFITLVILVASALVGVETYPEIEKQHQKLLDLLDHIIIAIFVIEIVIKIAAEGKKPWRYFADAWNVFDFLIVAACFLPFDNQYVTVLRLIRLLRALRLLSAFPKLQVLVSAIFKSLPSMGYVWLLMGLLFYVYAVAGVLLFGKNDPLHFGNLSSSLLSLFQVSTLEGWPEILNVQLYGCDKFGYENFKNLCVAPSAASWSPAYFISFILFGTFILVNLFVGVVLNGLEEARAELAEQKFNDSDTPRERDRRRVEAEIAKLNASLKVLRIARVKFAKKSADQDNS
jgi:voltage-gated sodium channel